jgi:transcriptional regulator with GAF, ATPase, and Fis domain
MIKIDDFIFVEKGSKTILTQNCSVNSKSYITACLFPYFKGTFAAASQEYMDRFKKLAEQ